MMIKSKANKIRGKTKLPIIGWREWVGLPDFGIKSIKVKVDTGARSSSIHAFQLHRFKRDGIDWVSFYINPVQRRHDRTIKVEAVVIDTRSIRSSSGVSTERPVIKTNVTLLGVTWPVELTLANRDAMGFRMLLGREAFRRRFLVDAGNSYYSDRPKCKFNPENIKENV